jgi:hypothetical protein
MVGIKTTGEQISILCHNGTIFDKPREKTGLAIKRHVGDINPTTYDSDYDGPFCVRDLGYGDQ